jgi:hypothetical protein
VVINPIPVLKEGKSHIEYDGLYLDDSILSNCHSDKDSVDTIDIKDMKEFVEEVLIKILK